MRTTLNLVRAFARPRTYLQWVQLTAVGLVVALACITCNGFLSAQHIVQTQNDVRVARAPHQPDVLPLDGTLPRIVEATDRWGGTTVTRVVLIANAEGEAPTPPGVPRSPSPGEAFVSPAVWALRGTDAPAWQAVKGFRVVGTIDATGLVNPSEARMIIGGDPDSTRRAVLVQFDQFGDPTTPGQTSLVGPLAFLAAGALGLVLASLTFAALIAARLREAEVRRRDRILTALGLGPWSTRLVSCAEVAAAAAVGAVVGALVFNLWWRRLERIPGTDLRFWASSSHVDPVSQIAVCALCAVTAIALGGTALGRERGPSTRTSRVPSQPRLWNIAPLCLAVAVMTTAWLAKTLLGDAAKVVALIGAAIALLSVPLAGRPAAYRLGLTWARRARTASGVLAGRWMSRTETATFKVAQLLGVGLFALCLSLPVVQNLRGDTTSAQADLASADGTNVLIRGTTLTVSRVQDLPAVRFVLPVVDATDVNGNSVTVLIANCDTLSSIVSAKDCSDSVEAQWINVYGGDLAGYVGQVAFPLSVNGTTIPISLAIDDTQGVVRAPVSGDFQGAIRIAPDVWAPPPRTDLDFLVNVGGGRPQRDLFAAALAGSAPTATLSNSFEDIIDQSNALLPAIQFSQTSLVLALLAMALTLTASVARGIQDTARAERLLDGLGATRTTTALARATSQAYAVLLQCAIAVAAGFVFWRVFAEIDPLSTLGLGSMLKVACIPLVLAVLTGLVAAPAPTAASRRKR